MHEVNLELRKPFCCAFKGCGYRAAKKAKLSDHVERRHTLNRTRDFRCPFSSSKFFEKWSLTAHIQSHVQEKSLLLCQCNFKTHHASSLWNHERSVHDKTMNFKCSFRGCSLSTNWKVVLNRHSKRTIRIRSFGVPVHVLLQIVSTVLVLGAT